MIGSFMFQFPPTIQWIYLPKKEMKSIQLVILKYSGVWTQGCWRIGSLSKGWCFQRSSATAKCQFQNLPSLKLAAISSIKVHPKRNAKVSQVSHFSRVTPCARESRFRANTWCSCKIWGILIIPPPLGWGRFNHSFLDGWPACLTF